MKTIASTRILCTDHPKHPRHEVRLYEDGSMSCDCKNGVAEGQRIGAAVMLGATSTLRRSCAGFVAFVAVGMPKLVEARVDVTGHWGGWKSAWTDYATNQVVRERFRALTQERDAEHAEALKIAHRALTSCSRYRGGMSRSDFGDEVVLVPNGDVSVGTRVALFLYDRWTVPLQKGWLESVGKAKPVIDGRFIVGVNEEHAGFVYAIDGDKDEGFEICEFAVVGGRLGKVATRRPGGAP